MNLTSLLDITFVLLIAFMIVAPTLKHGLEIDLPESKNTAPLSSDQPVLVGITKRKDAGEMPRLYLDGRRLEAEDLEKEIHAKFERNPQLTVIVECDQHEESGVLVQVIGAIQAAGVQNVGIAAMPE